MVYIPHPHLLVIVKRVCKTKMLKRNNSKYELKEKNRIKYCLFFEQGEDSFF